MRAESLTLAEASAVCLQHQFLVGHALTTEPTDISIIESVMVAPHDDVEKRIFACQYMEGARRTIAEDTYACHSYDVILLARYRSDNSKVLYTDLHCYLEKKAELNLTIE
jgi:hypothetical protein